MKRRLQNVVISSNKNMNWRAFECMGRCLEAVHRPPIVCVDHLTNITGLGEGKMVRVVFQIKEGELAPDRRR